MNKLQDGLTPDIITSLINIAKRRYNMQKWRAENLKKELPKKEEFIELLLNNYKFGFKCFYCGKKLEISQKSSHVGAPSIDHKIPLTKGGTNHKDNLVVCCFACNVIKGPLTADTYLKLLDEVGKGSELFKHLFEEYFNGRTEGVEEKDRENYQVFIDRGMNKDECKAICTSPLIPLREKLFFREIYETTFRPFEVQHLKIEDWNRKTGEITAKITKVKYNTRTGAKICEPRSMKLSEKTNEMLRFYVSTRKKGCIFHGRNNKPLTLRFFEKEIDRYAKLLNIQKEKQKTPTGRIYHLVTLMALREAGERHHDQNGGDPATSAKAAGHTMLIKSRYYKKGSFEEAQTSFEKHHPAFQENW